MVFELQSGQGFVTDRLQTPMAKWQKEYVSRTLRGGWGVGRGGGGGGGGNLRQSKSNE